jgi:hypothetical protein
VLKGRVVTRDYPDVFYNSAVGKWSTGLEIMRKYAIAFMSALTVIVIFTVVSKTLVEIPNFLIGWISCMWWYIGNDLVK